MAEQLRKLDRTRHFGEIYGNSEARFEQFGILFDADERELPGFEHIEVPDKVAVIDAADTSALTAEIERLKNRNGELTENLAQLKIALEDGEAELEGLQGQLDTANIEIKRLRQQVKDLEEAQKPAEATSEPAQPTPPVAAAAEKGKKGQQSDIDAQLALQEKA